MHGLIKTQNRICKYRKMKTFLECTELQKNNLMPVVPYLPFLQFWCLWPNDLETLTTNEIVTKFEVDVAFHCQLMTLLLLTSCVTLWPRPLVFWSLSLVIYHITLSILHRCWTSYQGLEQTALVILVAVEHMIENKWYFKTPTLICQFTTFAT